MTIEESACLPRTSHQRLPGADSNLFWGVTGATLLMLLSLGFFLRGGVHGLYMDDYSMKAWAFDFGGHRWTLALTPFESLWTWRPLTYLLEPNLAKAIPGHEFFVRVGIVVIHFLNVCLLARLGQRLSGSLLVGILCGGYFLFPVLANEGLLWFTAAVPDTFCLFFLLVGFHLLLSCRSLADLALLICGIASWFVMMTFYESGLFILLLLPASFAFTEGRRTNHKLWASALAASFIPICIYLWLVVRNSPFIIARGGAKLDLSFILLRKVPEIARGLWWLITAWGIFGPLHEAFNVGWREWLSVSGGRILIAGTLTGICLMALLFAVDRDATPSLSRLFKVILFGLGWIVLGLAPIALARFQPVEIRTLYIPSAGFALAAAAFSGLIANLFGRPRAVLIRATLGLAGAIVFLSSLTMAGLVRAYELRWYLDQRQVDALGQVMPMLPRLDPVWLLPVTLDEKTVGKSGGTEGKLDVYLDGVFETPWSARDALRLKFGDRNILAVTANRWVKLHVSSVQTENGQPSTITIQDTTIPIEQLLAFTYRQGRLILLNPLGINTPDGKLSAIIDLPLVAKLAREGLGVEKVQFQLDH
jgi:hypothetical protein